MLQRAAARAHEQRCLLIVRPEDGHGVRCFRKKREARQSTRRHAASSRGALLRLSDCGTAEVFAYDIRGNTAVPLGEIGGANWGGDWGRGPDSIHITFRSNFLYVDSCKDDECAMREVRTYALRADKLVKVYVQTHKNSDPLAIIK